MSGDSCVPRNSQLARGGVGPEPRCGFHHHTNPFRSEAMGGGRNTGWTQEHRCSFICKERCSPYVMTSEEHSINAGISSNDNHKKSI